MMINSIFEGIHENVNTSLHGDNGAMWVVSQDLTGARNSIQAALEKISQWSHIWGLKIVTGLFAHGQSAQIGLPKVRLG